MRCSAEPARTAVGLPAFTDHAGEYLLLDGVASALIRTAMLPARSAQVVPS